MASVIKCNVDNCAYWQENSCTASGIQVNMQGNKEEVCSPDVTYCETFETKQC